MSKRWKTSSRTVMNPKMSENRDGIEIEDRQFQKMNVLGNIMCGIAHDLNNILTIILGFAELANCSESRGSRSYLQELTIAATQGRDLVQQILLFGSQQEQEPKPINLATVVKEVLHLLRASIPATIEIDSERAAQPSLVLADPIQISQILMNLCLNGVHSMSTTGGVLEVSLLNVKLTRENMKDYPDLTPGPFVRLRVRDTGSGISPQVIERIFDPFFTTKPSGGGTGMGLAVVQNIVVRHHGMISVDSVQGQGTIFNIFLPSMHEVFEMQEVGEEPVAKGNECILFVGNEESICQVVQEQLQSFGYTVITQTSSQEALAMFLRMPDQFDLVMTDISMPYGAGERLAKKLRSIRTDIPIILCMGGNHAVAEAYVKALGGQTSVLKPFSLSEVTNTIKQVLDRASEERRLKLDR